MKGISALISAVLLLTVTVAAVSIFSAWAPNLVQEVTERTGNQTKSEVNCNQAALKIVTAKYDSGNTTVAVRNEGGMDLEIRIEAWRNELPQNSTTASVNSGSLKTKNVTTDSKPDRIETISTSCENARHNTEDIS